MHAIRVLKIMLINPISHNYCENVGKMSFIHLTSNNGFR